jgi:hypothetical protein
VLSHYRYHIGAHWTLGEGGFDFVPFNVCFVPMEMWVSKKGGTWDSANFGHFLISFVRCGRRGAGMNAGHSLRVLLFRHVFGFRYVSRLRQRRDRWDG